MSFDTPTVERDLRSAHKDSKRTKDSLIKWSNGSRPARHLHIPAYSLDLPDDIKVRPQRSYHAFSLPMHDNIAKAHRGHGSLPPGRARSSIHAMVEIDDAQRLSAEDLCGSFYADTAASASTAAATSAYVPDAGILSGVLYSYDNAVSPAPALTLDAFFKPSTHTTEQLVQKEYEVLDGKGNAVKGRKVRQVLRRAAATNPSASSAESAVSTKAPTIDVLDDEDFEFV